jgi:hypothetical protein
VALPPYVASLAYPSDTASMSMTGSNTASVSNTGSVTASPSATRSATASISATATATTSGGSLPSITSSPTPSTSPLVARFPEENILVLRGGTPGGTLVNGQAQPLTLLEFTPSGDLVSSIPVPTVSNAVEDGGDGSIRCALAFSNAGYSLEGFMQRSIDKQWTIFPCNDVNIGAAYPNDIPRRVVTLVRADGALEQFGVSNVYRNTTGSSSLWRTLASPDGNSFYATGAASTAAYTGMVYIPSRGAPGEIISAINGANQRCVCCAEVAGCAALQRGWLDDINALSYAVMRPLRANPSPLLYRSFVHIGPSWPGSGNPASTPQLYVSIRDPNGLRGECAGQAPFGQGRRSARDGRASNRVHTPSHPRPRTCQPPSSYASHPSRSGRRAQRGPWAALR